jgi:flagellar hook-basal body complex protein FliE
MAMDIAAISLNGASGLQRSLGAASPVPVKPGGQGFGDLLTNLVDKVDGLQKTADASVADVITGKVTDVHQVAVKVQEAGVAFDLMLGVRNRLMDAYQELIKMQA